MQWLFLVFTFPIIVTLILCRIKDVYRGDIKLSLVLFLVFVALFPLTFILMELPKNKDNGYFGIFAQSVSGASLVSFLMFYVLMFCVVIVGLHIKSSFSKLAE